MSGWRKVLKPTTESVPQSKDSGPDKPTTGRYGHAGAARPLIAEAIKMRPNVLNGPALKKEAQSRKMTNRYSDKTVGRA